MLPVFYQALYDRCRGNGYDVDLVRVLVDLATILPKVKNKHPLEILELNKRLNVIMAMLKECVENSKCFNDNSKIKEILCYRSLGETVTDLNGTKHAVTYTNELVNRGQVGVFSTCLREVEDVEAFMREGVHASLAVAVAVIVVVVMTAAAVVVDHAAAAFHEN